MDIGYPYVLLADSLVFNLYWYYFEPSQQKLDQTICHRKKRDNSSVVSVGIRQQNSGR